jgi:hypothetical protein
MKHYEESVVPKKEVKEQTILIETVEEPYEEVKEEAKVEEAEGEDKNEFHILETA